MFRALAPAIAVYQFCHSMTMKKQFWHNAWALAIWLTSPLMALRWLEANFELIWISHIILDKQGSFLHD